MTVAKLIEELQALNPSLSVVYEVNGDVTRTGDYMDVDSADAVLIRKVDYGGYMDARNPSDPDAHMAIVIR